ncbi:ATP-binding Cassette (ABC) Superfamily [Achlya hypogyna]|uniref:ATP-binding Cassette (ABC) Superfamily n=1 Tax=Achlya hypogyna TaxID=1202772 RepID=A0A1V9ZTJ3_ACHHY|nr:ATP-binding Cassette (ABC) Superfamily [Achlya hypogyna]
MVLVCGLSHIKTLLWKNRIVKQRHWLTTLLEVVFPTLLMILFAYFKTLQGNQAIPAGWQISNFSAPVIFGFPSKSGLFTTSGNGYSAYFIAAETTMPGLLWGLSFKGLANIASSLTGAALVSCKIQFTYMGFVNTDENAAFAIPAACADAIIPYKIAIAPKTEYTTKYFGEMMAKWYPRVPLMRTNMPGFNATLAVPSFADSVIYFATPKELEEYMASEDYGSSVAKPIIYAAIVFDSVPKPGVVGDVEYTIRMSSTRNGRRWSAIIPHTNGLQNKAVDPLQKNIVTRWYSAYTREGFATLQTLMTKFLACAPVYVNSTVGGCSTPKSMSALSISIITALSERLLVDNAFAGAISSMLGDESVKNATNINDTKTLTQQLPLGSMVNLLLPLLQAPQAYLGSDVYPFPIQGYISAPFFETIASVFPLVFIVAYLYAVSKVLVVLIQEKETKARELMKILGVSESAIVLSWFLTYLVIFLVASVLQALAGTLLFPNTSGGILWILFFLFSMTTWAYGFIVSTFFTNARTGSLVGVSVFFAMYFVVSALAEATEGAKMLASLLAPVALALCIQVHLIV